MQQKGIQADQIYGYEREEFTHLSVAAQIASGSADAGLGIYSAAASYGLDFIPVCVEQYDILMDETFTQSTLFDAFASIIRSKEFEERLTQLGGYTFTDTGKMVEYLD